MPEDWEKYAVKSSEKDGEDWSQFEVKKNPTPPVSKSGGQPLNSGSNPFQKSVDTKQPSILTPKGKSEYQEQVKGFKPQEVVKEGQPKPAKKVDGGAAMSFMKGLSDVNEGIFKIPRYLYDLAAIPQNIASQLLDTPELQADYDNIVKSSGYTSPLSVIDRLGDHFKGTANQYESRIQKYDKGIVDSFTSGDYADGGKQILNNIAGSVPSVILMATTAGGGNAAKLGYVSKTLANALPFASQKNAQIDGSSDIPQYVKTLNATLNGLSEVIFDQSFGTQAAISNVINLFEKEGKQAAVDAAKSLAQGYVKAALKKVQPVTSVAKGALEEMTTQLSQNLVDKYTINPDIDLMQGVLDAGVVGGATAGGISTVGTIAFNSSQKKKVGELMKQRSELVDDLDNDKLSDDVKDDLSSRLSKIDDNISKLDDDSESALSQLPEEDKQLITEKQAKITAIEKSLQDETLSETSQEILADKLLKEQDAIDDILSKPINNDPFEELTTEQPNWQVVSELQAEPVAEDLTTDETTFEQPIENPTNDNNLESQPRDANLDGENTTGTTTIDSSTQADTGEGTQGEIANNGNVSEVGDQVVSSDVVLQKAETDLYALKQVTDKVKKYEGSIKRLSEAKKAGQITEAEFNSTKERFDDVMADYTPKGAKANIGEAIPDQVLSEDTDLDNVEVPKEKKAFHAEQKDKAVADIKAQWQKLSVVGIANNPIQQDKDVAKLLGLVGKYSYHSFMDGSVKLKGKIADIVDEIINRLGLDGISKAQYKQIADAIKVEADKARTELKAFKVATKTIIKENTQVKSDFKSKDLISKLTQFKKRLADEVRGSKRGVKEGKAIEKEKQQSKDDIISGLREEIKLQIKEAKDSGLISNRIKPQTFVNAVNRLNNAKTPMQLLKAIDYMSKVFGDIDYDNHLTDANSLRSQVKKLAKRKGLPSNIAAAMRNIARAVPSELGDLKEYNTLMTSVIDNVKGESITGIDTGILNDVAEWLAKEQQRHLKERYELLIGQQEGFSYEEKTLEQMKAEIDELSEEGYEEKDNRRDADEAVSELLREEILEAELDDYNHPREIEAIKALKEVDLAGLSDKDLRLYNIAVNNLLLNGKLNGIGSIIAVAKKQKNFSNKAYIAGIKETTRAVSEWADNIRADWSTTVIQMKAFANSDTKLAKFYVVTGLSEIKNGYTRSSDRTKQVEKGVESIIKKHKNLRNSPERQLEVAVFADLNQYEDGSTQDGIAQQFADRKTALLETIDRLKIKSETDVTFAKQHKNYVALLEGIYDRVKDLGSASEIKLGDDQLELYTYMRDFYDSIQEDTRLNAEIYNNINFEPVNNYFPRSYNLVDDLFGANAEKQMETKIITGTVFYSKDDLKKEEAGTKQSRTIKGSELPMGKVINLDLVSNFLNTARNILYDIETQPARQYTARVTTDADAMRELTADDSITKITKRVALHLVTNQRLGILPKHSKTVWKAFGEFYRGTANRFALGGVSQIVKQSAASFVTTATALGENAGYLPLSIHDMVYNNEAANKLMDGLPISRREQEKSALTHVNVKESDIAKLNRSMGNVAVRVFDKWNDAADYMSLRALVVGDVLSAKASFLAFYKDFLVKEGVIKSISEFNLEHEAANRNEAAAEYAEQMVSSTLNINDRTMSPKLRPVGGILPFMSFSINAKFNVAIDIARASRKGVPTEERRKAASMVAGHILSSIVLNGIAWYIRDWTIEQSMDIVQGLVSDDEDEEKTNELLKYANELEMEMLKKNKQNTYGYIAKDIMIGGILAPVTDPFLEPIISRGTALVMGEEYKEAPQRPADALTLVGLYGIPAKAMIALGSKYSDLMLTDEEFTQERYGIESADGSKVYVPKENRGGERSDWARKSMALSAGLGTAQILSSMSSQEIGSISRRIPGIIKKLEDSKYGPKRNIDPANIDKQFAEITKDKKTYVLNEEQVAFRKKMKTKWLNQWYLAKKKFGTDKESEQEARERANEYSAAQTRIKFKGKLQLKE